MGFKLPAEQLLFWRQLIALMFLDKAFLRPGRFDRRVEVPFPDLTSREQILRLHAKAVKIDPEVDLAKIARGTPGFSGADLANIINEAAIIASKT